MIKLLVIADDFTGALDTGVQFSKKGIPTLVTTLSAERHCGASFAKADIEVLVVDLETRHIPAKQAYDTVFDLVAAARSAGVEHFYKKTDSALRGNIGAELAALLDACDARSLPFIPAFPRSGRTTKNGLHYVDGVRLHDSVFSADPFSPILHSSVAAIIGLQSDIATVNIPTDRYGEKASHDGGKSICIYDAESDQDLLCLGEILRSADSLRALAGCAGFAALLPDLLGLCAARMEWSGNSENILIISGSVNQITLDQIHYAKRAGYHAITLSSRQKLDSGFMSGPDGCLLVEEIATALERHKRVIVESVDSREQVALANQYAAERGIPPHTLRSLINDNIGEMVRRLLSRAAIGNLAVFGGDTLYGIMKKIDCDGIRPFLEVSSGVVAAKIISPHHDFCMISKSGGLGDEDVIRAIDQFVFSVEK